MILVTVTLAIDCDLDEAEDAANEILREQKRSWVPHSSLLDYRIEQVNVGRAIVVNSYEEGDAWA